MEPVVLTVASAFLGALTLWAAWLSKTVIEIQRAVSVNATTQADHERRIEELEKLLPRHIPAN